MVNKLIRRKSSPDSEQLLAPRSKSGFFGGNKRNNGVRSEDNPTDQKSLKSTGISARRLVSSVFKSSTSNSNYKREISSSHDDADLPANGGAGNTKDNNKKNSNNNNNGTPKTAPSSPNLMVLTTKRSTSNPRNNNNARNRNTNSPHNSKHAPEDGDETVMSDLTGTISPTPPQPLPLSNASNHTPTTSSSSNNNNVADNANLTGDATQLDVAAAAAAAAGHGVTFSRRQDSFYSAHSPAMGLFQKNNQTSDSDGGSFLATNTAASSAGDASQTYASSSNSKSRFCKSSTCMLDQVLGVVDGACHRTLDLTLGGLGTNGSVAGTAADTAAPQWGVAPSEDDGDDSTCLDTATQTLTVGGEGTLYTATTADYASTARGGGDATTRTQGTTPTGTVASQRSRIETVPEEPSVVMEAVKAIDTIENATSVSDASPLLKESLELHENYELVLGKNVLKGKYDTYYQDETEANQKKKGWGSRLPFTTGGANTKTSTTTVSTAPISARTLHLPDSKEEEKKEDIHEAHYDDQRDNPPASPPGTPAAATADPVAASRAVAAQLGVDNRRENLYKSVFGDDFVDSPSRDVGIEIQSSRVLQKDLSEKKQMTASVASTKSTPKRALSSLVKVLRLGKVKRSKSTTSALPKPKRAESPAVSAKKKRFGSSVPSSSAPPPPALNETDHKEVIAAAFDLSRVARSFTGEEEEKEVESNHTPDMEEVASAYGAAAMKMADETPQKSNSKTDVAPEIKPKASRPEMTGLSSEPIPVNLGSKSFSKAEDSAPAAGTDNTGSTEKTLDQYIPLNRLQSAPVTLSSSEALQQQKEEQEEEERLRLNKSFEGSVTSIRRKAPRLTWKATVDAQGRTYYYHRETRKTSWSKPAEFDDEVAAVKKYKEDMEAAKKEAAETQQVIDGCKNVEAIQASLRKKTQRDFDPQVWETKQEILDIVKTMPLPRGTNIERLLVQYDGKEGQLLGNLRDLVESKPFDEPFQPPTGKKEDPQSQADPAESNLNISHASSSVSSSANYQTVDVQQRVRTAVSASTHKTAVTEKTEKVRNTFHGQPGINPIREHSAMSTGSISSASGGGLPPRSGYVPFNPNGRVPSKIPAAAPRSRNLKVEEFTDDMVAKETFNGQNIAPLRSNDYGPTKTASKSAEIMAQCGAKAVAEQIVALSSLDDDGSSYHGDYDDTVDDRGNDTASKMVDSISALSEADADYQLQKENFERTRRRALDVAVEREDWDLAAALSEGMKQVKDSLYGKDAQREWTQTELDRFISENDWDAVSKYIAHMRDHPAGEASAHLLPNLATPRGRDPESGTRLDPDGFSPSMGSPLPTATTSAEVPPSYVSKATKRASGHTQNGRRKNHEASAANTSVDSSEGSRNRGAQTHFGARSQLQHNELNSISSWDNSSSSSDSEYTDNSYESEDDQGYISLRVRRNEFEC